MTGDVETLLRLTAATLRERVAPAAPGAARYQALMAANAAGIAAREAALGARRAALTQAVREAAAAALGRPCDDLAALVAALRQGQLRGRPELHRAILALAALEAAIAKPSEPTPEELALAGLTPAELA